MDRETVTPTLHRGHRYFHQSVEMPSVSRLLALAYNPKAYCPECGVADTNEFIPQDAIDWGDNFHEFAADYFAGKGSLWPAPYVAWMDYVSSSLGIRQDVVVEQPIGIKDGYAGTPDAMDIRGNTLRVFDWKTGIETKLHRKQLLAYAGVICKTMQWADRTSFQVGELELVNVYFNKKDVQEKPVIKRRGAPVNEAVRMADMLLATRTVWALAPSF